MHAYVEAWRMTVRRFAFYSSLASFTFAATSQAVILYSTGDPASHTTAPTGTLSNSGWQ